MMVKESITPLGFSGSFGKTFKRDGYGCRVRQAVSELERTVWAHHHRIATQRTAHAITERGCMSTLRVFCEALKAGFDEMESQGQ